MRKNFLYALVAAFVAFTSLASADLFTADFETDQSANFSTTIFSLDTPQDANANFNFDVTTFVQASTTGSVAIPTNPNGATTKVLRLNANIASSNASADGADSVTVFPTVTVGTDWEMSFDWMFNYNFPASGSTMLMFVGAFTSPTNSANTIASGGAAISNTGFYFGVTGEGGAAQDYRFYTGTGLVANVSSTGATWWGAAGNTNTNGTASSWVNFFVGVSSGGSYAVAGSPARNWVRTRLVVNGPTNTAKLYFKRYIPADTNYTLVGQATIPAMSTFRPFIAHGDLNNTRPSPTALAADNFVLVDNININNIGASVDDWSLHY